MKKRFHLYLIPLIILTCIMSWQLIVGLNTPSTSVTLHKNEEVRIPIQSNNGQNGQTRSDQDPSQASDENDPLGQRTQSTEPTEDPTSPDVGLQLPSSSIQDILKFYETMTGKTILADSSVFQTGVTIRLMAPNAKDTKEKVRFIESALLENGYVIVPVNEKTSTLRYFGAGKASSKPSDGIPITRDPGTLPTGDSIASYFMSLKYLSPEEAKNLFVQHLGENLYGAISPITNPSGLLITESASRIRQLISIKEIVDSPSESDKMKTGFIDIEHAEASHVAQIIQAMLDNQRQIEQESGPTNLGRSNNQNNANPLGQPTPSSSSNNQDITNKPPAQIVGYDRLNRIMIIAPAEDYDYIADLVKSFDQPLPSTPPLEYFLQYAFAEEILPVIIDALKDTGTGNTVVGNKTISTKLDPTTSNSTGNLAGGSQDGRNVQAQGAGSENPDLLDAPDNLSKPVSITLGNTRVIADPRANTIFAYGPKATLRKIREVINLLDRPQPQVYLATVIGQLTLSDDMAIGFDYLSKFQQFDGTNRSQGGIAGNLLGNGAGGAAGSSITDIRDNIIGSAVGAASGLNVYGQIGRDLEAFVTALETTNKFKVLSRPVIHAVNNKKAVIEDGRRVPVPASSISSGFNNGGSQNFQTNIDYEDVTLKLEFVPLINRNGEVTLTVSQVNDTIVGEQAIDNNSIPIIGTQRLTTTVTVPDRKTIVLGGLISEEKSNTTSGLPYLSKIPVLGIPFKRNEDTTTRRELIIFVQPIIVNNPRTLQRASLSEDLRTEIGAEAFDTFPPANPLPQIHIDEPQNDFFPKPIPARKAEPSYKNTNRGIPKKTTQKVEQLPKQTKSRWRPRKPFRQ